MMMGREARLLKREERNGRRIGRALLALAAGIIVLVLTAALILTRPFAEAPWEEAPPNPESIYADIAGRPGADNGIPVISPFHLHTEPMARLLLINFEKDPDSVYVGFEPQSFDDDVQGRGLLVIGWRVDGRVDVFHEAGLQLNPEGYGIAGKGLHAMVERSFSSALFKLGPEGAQTEIAFHDLVGRPVRLVVRETDPRPRTASPGTRMRMRWPACSSARSRCSGSGPPPMSGGARSCFRLRTARSMSRLRSDQGGSGLCDSPRCGAVPLGALRPPGAAAGAERALSKG